MSGSLSIFRKPGRNASLKLDSQAGKASVTLQLDLGHPVPPQHPHMQTNSRDRRRYRRADIRKAGVEEAENRNVNLEQIEEAVAFEVAENATEQKDGNASKG